MKAGFNVAILSSGNGGLMRRALSAAISGTASFRVTKIVASSETDSGLTFARELGVPTAVIKMDGHDNTQSRLWAEIAESKAHGVILLGWLRKLFVPHSWQNRVINSHPSLLPLFGGKGMWGARVHRAVMDSGMRVSGCTYHFVDNEYDSGPIIAQYSTPIADSDTVETLTSRVISMQHKSLLPVMNAWAEDRFREIGNRWVGAPSQEHLPD